ncbi:MAG: bifunctional nicotinamide-nucleotide adenylyltransferase/Nudix hydroxylase [Burkholderiales bacterium]|nr:bifunctional nicotinamide-nucleotide adenylyltransferase/Nudix hydroxylase [Burkholderiales bacterium]
MSQDIEQHDVAVYIGRFQPFHNGHLALLKQALGAAPLCVIVIGSAFQARSPKNPFTWEERAEMIRLALPESDRARVLFLPVRDYYDETRWTAVVRRGVDALLAARGGKSHSIVLIGHFKDPTSEYLKSFSGWRLVSVGRVSTVDATSLRDAFFGHAGCNVEAAVAALVSQAPGSTLDFLRAWAALPWFEYIATEWEMLKRYKEAWSTAPYPPIFVTVDAIVRCNDRVLLIRRGQAPGKGLFAAPGGFIEQRETAYQSAIRELKEETHLSLLDMSMRHALKATAVFDHPDRSQRGRTITHAHFFDLGERELPEVRADDDAASVEWVSIEELASLEDQFLDDHFHMLDHFLGVTGEE